MELSLGYLKDVTAFLSSILFFILYFRKNLNIQKEFVLFFYSLVLFFDGLFTFFPILHNLVIFQSV